MKRKGERLSLRFGDITHCTQVEYILKELSVIYESEGKRLIPEEALYRFLKMTAYNLKIELRNATNKS